MLASLALDRPAAAAGCRGGSVPSTTAVGAGGRPRPSAVPSRASWKTIRPPGATCACQRRQSSAQPPSLWSPSTKTRSTGAAPAVGGVLAALEVPDDLDVRAAAVAARATARRVAQAVAAAPGRSASGLVAERVDQVQLGAPGQRVDHRDRRRALVDADLRPLAATSRASSTSSAGLGRRRAWSAARIRPLPRASARRRGSSFRRPRREVSQALRRARSGVAGPRQRLDEVLELARRPALVQRRRSGS